MNDCQLNTPVVLLIFNRPDTTQRVFEAIRQAKPTKLMLVADGARRARPGEAEKCQATKKIVERVDWNCEVLTNYSEVNLGCKQRVSSGLDWVFKNVGEAIILEDDCLPHPSFFRFCDELLQYYRDDRRIMVIAGNNFQMGRKSNDYSYYFSRYNHCWGWATWKRAWQHYDITMKLWPKIRDTSWLKCILEEPRAIRYWNKIFQATYQEDINSWAYRWTFTCWLQNGLTVLPNVNLVSNIGFGTEGTHTTNIKHKFANLAVAKMDFPLQHPPFMIRDFMADKFTQNNNFSPSLTKRVINKTQRTFLQLMK